MRSLSYTLLMFVFALFNSCSNEIDLFADYEESVSVFAMLDPNQPIQFVKINKVFINKNASAYDVAKIPDSLFFDSLAPTLTEVETGRVIPLFKYSALLKDAGIFASAPNYLYATKKPIYAFDPKSPSDFYHYRLDFDLPSQKKHISALTNIPDSTILLSPVNIVTPAIREVEFTISGSLRFVFQAPTNSKIFDGYFYFNYREVNKLDTTVAMDKFFRFRLIPNVRAYDDHSHESISVSISSDIFYDFMLNNLKVDTTIERRFMPCKLELTCANLEYDNYFQVTQPSIGIVQKQTEYTNIKNGVGIFASRRLSRYNNLAIGPLTRKGITTLPQYKVLGFRK